MLHFFCSEKNVEIVYTTLYFAAFNPLYHGCERSMRRRRLPDLLTL